MTLFIASSQYLGWGRAGVGGTQRFMTLTKKAPLSEVHVLQFENQCRHLDVSVLLVSGLSLWTYDKRHLLAGLFSTEPCQIGFQKTWITLTNPQERFLRRANW